MTKQGGSVKTWKRRWFILKAPFLYYFKANTPETEEQGQIELMNDSFVKYEEKHNKKKTFGIGRPNQKRVFIMFSDDESETDSWMKSINSAIESLKGKNEVMSANPMIPTSTENSSPIMKSMTPLMNTMPSIMSTPKNSVSLRQQLLSAKNKAEIFCQQEKFRGNSAAEYEKFNEFWKIWFDSICPREMIKPGFGFIEYEVASSADMQKITWKTSGPQEYFIQQMVDFFWNVGAPEEEINRLNEVGSLINPPIIGSWIDVSRELGMDGGWFFPSEIPLEVALSAADPGYPTQEVSAWAKSCGIENCNYVGRDMGAIPPRQTEIRFDLKINGFEQQLNIVIGAFSRFGFPELPKEALNILRTNPIPGLRLSLVISDSTFIRIGVMFPDPDTSILEKLLPMAGAPSLNDLTKFSDALGLAGPQYIELQYLTEGFGYSVYKEGFDEICHFLVGREQAL